jgi:hypothetical protein
MAKSEKEMRGQIPEAKFVSSLSEVIRETTRLWRRCGAS